MERMFFRTTNAKNSTFWLDQEADAFIPSGRSLRDICSPHREFVEKCAAAFEPSATAA